MTVDIENALGVVNDILMNEVLPYFQSNHPYSASDMSVIMSQFVSVQSKLLSIDTMVDADYQAILTRLDNIPSLSGVELAITRSTSNPTAIINPSFGVGALWINTLTGEIFVCIDSTDNLNKWYGSRGTFAGYSPRNIFDVFGDASCVALFKFNNDLLDVGGAVTVTSSVGVSYVAGKFDKSAYILNGRIATSSSALLGTSTSNFSLSFWAKSISGLASTFVSKYSASMYDFRLVLNVNRTFTINFAIGSSSVVAFTSPIILAFNDSNFHHVALSVDKVNMIMKMYVDGELVFVVNIAQSYYQNTQPVTIGADVALTGTAIIQQLRFFNRALTAKEALYLSTEGGVL